MNVVSVVIHNKVSSKVDQLTGNTHSIGAYVESKLADPDVIAITLYSARER